MDPSEQIKNLPKHHDFFVGIDSDGCVFDTMEIKHKECFCPNFIKHFSLQVVSKYAREAWEFINLYSKHRGCNRFLAVQRSLDVLAARSEVANRNASIPPLPSLRDWTRHESQLGNPTLEAEVERTGDAELQQVLDWSLAVNAAVTELVHGIPPFPGVAETFEAGAGHADMIVVSATPLQTLQREWQEIQLDHYLQMIAGQEQGSKTEHLEYAARGKYDPDKILMIGDAPGDLKAASTNGALFFPVVPGREEQSWANLASEGIDRFFTGRFAGAYQQTLLAEFDKALPENPPWQGSG